MSACCVSSCKNRYSSTSNIKFYRIPSGSRPFQANRRRLWEKIIKRANGSNELNGNARICGAHFISGKFHCDFRVSWFSSYLMHEQNWLYLAHDMVLKLSESFCMRVCVFCRRSVHGPRQSWLCAFCVCLHHPQKTEPDPKEKCKEEGNVSSCR